MKIKSKVKLHSPARLTIILVTGVLVALFAWGTVGKIDQSSRAQGQVVAPLRTQFIQAEDDGVIQSLEVSEGQRVKRGDLLVRFNAAQAETSMGDSRAKVAALKATLARLSAEVSGRPLIFPKVVQDFPDFIKNQSHLFKLRQRSIDQELASLKALQSSVASELAMSEPLLKTGDISLVEILRLKKSVAEFDGTINNRRNKYFQDAQSEMTKYEEELKAQEQILVGRKQLLERTELVSPADGIIRNIRVSTRGARVRPGDVVMDILPTDGDLIFETKVKPMDIAFIHVGLPASIKLDSYDYSIYGVIEGEVSYVSPDALNEDTRMGEQVYYRVRIRINPKNIAKAKGGKTIELQPGMTGQADMHTGRQTVISYLLKPLVKTVSGAFSER
jgi:multidrug efflux pump subunit AcrA (membrane-fusion protein)